MNQNRWSRRVLIIISVICGVSLVATVALGFAYWRERSQLEQAALTDAHAQADAAANQINDTFAEVMDITRDISISLQNGDVAKADLNDYLFDVMDDLPNADGVAVTYEPYTYDPEIELFWSYVRRDVNGDLFVENVPPYDYTLPKGDDPDLPETGWYLDPLANGEMWNRPYYGTAAGKYLVEYAVPFTDGESDEYTGVTVIDYSLRDMRNLMTELELGATGYGFVINETGTLLAHPIPEQVITSTIFELAELSNASGLADGATKALNGEDSQFESVDTVTGQESWVFFEPIPAAGWALGVVLNKAEFVPDPRRSMSAQMTIYILGAVFVYSVLLLLLQVHKGAPNRLWIASTSLAFIGMGLIVIAWTLSSRLERVRGIEVTDNAAIERYLNTYSRSADLQAEDLITVPTGIEILAVEFPDPKSVIVNGYVWQRYSDDLPDDLIQGFALPQLLGPEVTMDEVLRERQGDEEIVIWYIGTILRQSFNPSLFPFDNRDVRVRLAPADLSENIILVPDFDSYRLLNPTLLPGLSGDVDLNNWKFERSSYSYSSTAFNTNLGLNARTEFSSVPELVFTVNTRRYFVGPFIAYLLPGLVTALMMFGFMLRERPDDEQEEEDVVNALNYGAALFFVIAIIHTALRDNIAAVGITYVEHMYILLYVMIVLTAINTFLHVQRPDLVVIQYHNNLIPKLFYWPVISLALLISTLLTFIYT